MPEIKHNFTGAKMEKDLDERLVPNGAYRHAENIQISTSADNDIGTIQNIKGTRKVEAKRAGNPALYFSPPTGSNVHCVGLTADEANNKIYKLLHEEPGDLTWSYNGNNYTISPVKNTNFIIEYDRNKDGSLPDGGLGSYVLRDVYSTKVNILDSAIDPVLGYNFLRIENSYSMYYVRPGAILVSATSYQSGTTSIGEGFYVLQNDDDNQFNTSQGWLEMNKIPPVIQTMITNGEDIALTFVNPKVLGWDASTSITGINVMDNYLFFTDGVNEPKKIEIERCKRGTDGFIGHSVFSGVTDELFTDPITGAPGKGPIKEEHITVIKKAPTMAPRLDMKAKRVDNIEGNIIFDFSGVEDGDEVNMTIYSTLYNSAYQTRSYLDFRPGETLFFKSLTGQTYLSLFQHDKIVTPHVVVEVKEVIDNTDEFIEIVAVIKSLSDVPQEDAYYKVELDQKTPEIFQDKFVQFATRYKYVDGQYSTFSPFSEYAFIPGVFSYLPKQGYNLGMENRLLSVEIKDFIPTNIPKDVVQVDILYKQSDSPNIYLAKSIKHTRLAPVSAVSNSDHWLAQAGVTSPTASWYSTTASQLYGGYESDGGFTTGSYTIDSESTVAVLPSDQLLRHYDNVPRKALAQEVTANRLIYGNYTQGYDLKSKIGDFVTPEFSIELDWRVRLPQEYDSRSIPQYSRVPIKSLDYLEGFKSIKSMRQYQVGICYVDEFGRKTPIITNNSGVIKVKKDRARARNKIKARVLNHQEHHEYPSWAKYFKYYVKETSGEYFNLALDTYYPAEFDNADNSTNLWLAFFSSDRNKVEEGTVLQLKKGHGDQTPVTIDNKIKILAITNEAPESVKLMRKVAGTYDHDNTAIFLDPSGDGPYVTGYEGQVIELTDNLLLGVGETDDYWRRDNLVFRLREVDAFTNANINVSNFYNISWIRPIEENDLTKGFIMKPEKALEDDASFTGSAGNLTDGIHLDIYEETPREAHKYNGRFFAKVKNDAQIAKYIQRKTSANINYNIVASNNLYYYTRHVKLSPTNPNGPAGVTATDNVKFNDTPSGGVFNDSNTTFTGCDRTREGYDDSAWNDAFCWSCGFGNLNGHLDCFQHGYEYQKYQTNSEGGPKWIIDALNYAGEGPPIGIPWTVDQSLPGSSWGSHTHGSSLGVEGVDVSSYTGSNVGQSTTGVIDISFVGLDKVLRNNLSIKQGTGAGSEADEVQMYQDFENDWLTESGFANSLQVGHGIRFIEDPNKEIYSITNVQKQGLFNYQYWNSDDGIGKWGSDWLAGSMESPANHRLRYRLTLDRPISGLGSTGGNTWSLPTANDNTSTMRIEIVRPDITDTIDIKEETDKPAIFETEPKKKLEDIEIFHEASNLIPLHLDKDNFRTLVRPGNSISLHSTGLKIITRRVVDDGINFNAQGFALGTYTTIPVDSAIGIQPIQRIFSSNGMPVIPDPIVSAVDTASTPNTVTVTVAQEFNVGDEIRFTVPSIGGDGGSLDVSPIGGDVGSNITGTEIVSSTVKDGEISIRVKNINCNHPFQTSPSVPDGGLLNIGKGDLIRVWDVDSDNYSTFTVAHNYFDNPATGSTHLGFSPTLTGQNTSFNSSIFNYNGEGWINISEQPDYPEIIELKLELQTPTHVSLNWNNCYSFGNGVESDRIRDDFNQPILGNGAVVSGVSAKTIKEENIKSGLIYSGIFNAKSSVNELNQFNVSEKITKDINSSYGSIQKLHTRDASLIVLCEDKVLKVLANKDALFNADGNPQLISTNRVLGQVIPYIGEYGISKNPESFAASSYRAYFTDKERGAVMRLSKDGLTPISEHGMKKYFEKNLPHAFKNIGSYDIHKNSYDLTIQKLGGFDDSKTISFNERVKGWESFKSYRPERGVSLNNDYYTVKEGNLWHHYQSNTYNNFYNIQYHSSFTSLLNDFSGSVKTFNTLNYEGSQSKIVQFTEEAGGISVSNQGVYNDGQYYNLQGVDGWYVEEIITDVGKSTQQEGAVDEFIEKEGKWFNYIKGKDSGSLFRPTGAQVLDGNEFHFQGIGIMQNASITSFGGCTDPTAINYNPNATVDDGSCVACIDGCMDPTAPNYNASATCDDGSCVYEGCIDPNSFNYDPNANTACNPDCCCPFVYGCTDPAAVNAPTYTGDCELDINTPCDGTNFPSLPCVVDASGNMQTGPNCCCVYPVLGCTDSGACNYDSNANTDDGSCDYSCLGCTDPDACNYDPTATINSGTCIYCTYACLDPTSTNYINPTTITNPTPCDGGNPGCDNTPGNMCTGPGNGFGQCCNFPAPPGCTNPAACNYDAGAGVDDGTCCWASDSPISNAPTATRTGCNNPTAGDNPDINGYCNDGSVSCVNENCTYNGNTFAGIDNYGGCAGIGGWAVLNYDPIVCCDCDGADGNLDVTCCEVHVYGCMDPTALNYDCSTALNAGSNVPCSDNVTFDDGSCVYAGNYGCTDPTACNWNTQAIYDDGSCEYTSCIGCADNRYGYHPMVDASGALMSNHNNPSFFSIGFEGDINCTWCPSTPQACNAFDLQLGTACTDDGTLDGKPIGFFANNFDFNANPSLPANACCPGTQCNYTSGCPNIGTNHDPHFWPGANYNPIVGCNQTPGSVCASLGGVYDLGSFGGNAVAPNFASGPAHNFAGSTQYYDDNGFWPTWNTSWVLPPYGDGYYFPNPLNSSQAYISPSGMGNYGETCIPKIYGCILANDPVTGAPNFNVGDGCSSGNYWPGARPHLGTPQGSSGDPLETPNTHNQNCCVGYIYGCTDPTATNYDPNSGANMDDGSCCYQMGCTYPNARYVLNDYNGGGNLTVNGFSWQDIKNATNINNINSPNCIDFIASQSHPWPPPPNGAGILNCYGETFGTDFVEGDGIDAANPGNGIMNNEQLLIAYNGGNECSSGLNWAPNVGSIPDYSYFINDDGLLDPDSSYTGKMNSEGTSQLAIAWEGIGNQIGQLGGYTAGWGSSWPMCEGAFDPHFNSWQVNDPNVPGDACCCLTAGCPDRLAINFNPDACGNPGDFCIYPFDPNDFCPPWADYGPYSQSSGYTYPGCQAQSGS